MTLPDYRDTWRRYWAATADAERERRIDAAADAGRERRIDVAAADPLGGWLIAEVPTLVDEYDLDPAHLRESPDAVLDAGRDGFAAFVDERMSERPDDERAAESPDDERAAESPDDEWAAESPDDEWALERPADERYGYDVLAIHPTATTRVTGASTAFADPVDDAHTLTHVTARVTERPEVGRQPAVLTYRCPLGHETTIVQSPYRTLTLETCGNKGCSNAAHPEDRRTRVRRIVEFGVEVGGTTVPCVARGRYGSEDALGLIADADRLHLTGIGRLVTDAAGEVDPLYEVLHAEPA